MTLFDRPEGTRAAPSGPLVRVRLLVAYDGAAFHGFAPQTGLPTVAGTLAAVIERVVRHPVELTCAGRTDAGVHAWGQVVTFDADAERFDADRLQHAVNRLCGPSIVVRDAAVAPDDFDARFSARGRRYRYTILNRIVPDPFLAATSWHVPQPLDLDRLRLACDPLIGEHDFTAFCRKPKVEPEPSLTRRVLDARWEIDDGDVLRFWIEANAFCHQMVRSIVGTLVDVGLGRRTAADVASALRARSRDAAGPVAPPHGLVLWEVRYGNRVGIASPSS